MKKIKIVFNALGSDSIGSVRIPHVGFKSQFEKFDEFEVHSNDFENYDKYDVAILHGDDDEVIRAKNQNPSILIGLAKPHHERVVHSPLTSFSLKSFLYQYRFFTDDNKSSFMKKREHKLSRADFLIADTVHLKNYFELRGHDCIYLKLIEAYSNNVIGTTPVISQDNCITFGYHGNPRHLIESKDYIFPALNDLAKDTHVKLIVVTNIDKVNNKYFRDANFDIEFHEYSYPGIYSTLSSIDIGLVPNQISYKNKFFEKLLSKFGAFFWNTDRAHDLVFRYKQSVNAGRAFVFAQLDKPFVACPVPELLAIFGCFMEDCFPYDKETWGHVIIQLAKNKSRQKELAEELNKLVNTTLNVENEANILKEYIINRMSSSNHINH
ncbi:hypothetical protein NB574_10600 [Vibrio vulnificus]|uniref:hypothetical protein n=1 Tax=Vibrio vulnificus TaxID=672 RepID=UPI00215B94E1|nr:hypothetical protein [Vibrio vulnificus]MCR9703237.1 hypothetical protein [Vibrio vulnificus]